MICGGIAGQSHLIGNRSGSWIGVLFKLLKININTTKQTDKPIADTTERGDIRRILSNIIF
jgi:hypothetical protein